jgi:hypothetical protein
MRLFLPQKYGGAVEAGAPEFIDLLTSENKDLQLRLGGGIMWLDATWRESYGQSYLQCAPEQRAEILDLIAFRKNSNRYPRLGACIEFFLTLRKYTADRFFTSEIGIKYLGYIGNTYLKEFPGCPPYRKPSADLGSLQKQGATICNRARLEVRPGLGWLPSDGLLFHNQIREE